MSVSVMVQTGFQLSTLSKDKFLIMGMSVDSADMPTQEMTDMWKVGSFV